MSNLYITYALIKFATYLQTYSVYSILCIYLLYSEKTKQHFLPLNPQSPITKIHPQEGRRSRKENARILHISSTPEVGKTKGVVHSYLSYIRYVWEMPQLPGPPSFLHMYTSSLSFNDTNIISSIYLPIYILDSSTFHLLNIPASPQHLIPSPQHPILISSTSHPISSLSIKCIAKKPLSSRLHSSPYSYVSILEKERMYVLYEWPMWLTTVRYGILMFLLFD